MAILRMNEQNSSAMQTSDQSLAGRTQVGWGSWALSVLALAAVGAVSYLAGAVAPVAVFTLPPVAMMLFGFLAGGAQAFAWRRQVPPCSPVGPGKLSGRNPCRGCKHREHGPAETSEGLLAGWAYAWAAYGAVFGLMLQRISARRRLVLASLAGWATAGIASGAVGWALDVFQVAETVPTTGFIDLPSRTWSMAGLGVMGAVCGATGGAITGAALVLLSRRPVLPQDGGESGSEGNKACKGSRCRLWVALCRIVQLLGSPGPHRAHRGFFGVCGPDILFLERSLFYAGMPAHNRGSLHSAEHCLWLPWP